MDADKDKNFENKIENGKNKKSHKGKPKRERISFLPASAPKNVPVDSGSKKIQKNKM